MKKPQEKTLRIGWLWNTPERWNFHVKDKQVIYNMSNGEFNLKTLYSLLWVNESWLTIKPTDKVSPNFEMLLKIFRHYKTIYKNFNPPFLYKLAMPKIAIFILTLFREDTAYSERIGGSIQHILDNDNLWFSRKKEHRIEAIKELRSWWRNEDWRPRTHKVIDWLFGVTLDQYEKVPFVEQSLNYWVEMLISNKEAWHRQKQYDPKYWYPRGKGSLNYLINNREGYYDKTTRSIRWR